MPRKGTDPKRDVIPDPKYGNVKLAKFVNNLMQRGKKSTAVLFFPLCIKLFTNLASFTFPYFGSGITSLFGSVPFLGIT